MLPGRWSAEGWFGLGCDWLEYIYIYIHTYVHTYIRTYICVYLSKCITIIVIHICLYFVIVYCIFLLGGGPGTDKGKANATQGQDKGKFEADSKGGKKNQGRPRSGVSLKQNPTRLPRTTYHLSPSNCHLPRTTYPTCHLQPTTYTWTQKPCQKKKPPTLNPKL